MDKFLKESNHFFRIGFPMLGSQLSFMIMSATDTIVAGRAGADQLAGLVIANSFTYPIFMFMAGIIFAVIPIVAQLNGAKKDIEIGTKIREVFWLAILLGLLLVAIFYFGSELLIFLPIDGEIISISISYLKAISVGMFFYIMYRLLSSYSEGLTLTIPVFIVVFMGALINIPLDIIFVYGYFGLPEMGGVGCGYATTIVSTLMFVAMLGIVLFSKSYKRNKLFSRFDGPSLKTSLEVFKLGTPIGFGIFIELAPDEEQKQILENNIQMALQQQAINLEDAIDIREVRNLKLANQLLKLRRRKKFEQDRQIQMENMQAQSQSNAQSSQAAAAAEIQKQQGIAESKVQIAQAQTQFDISKLEKEAAIKKELMQFEFELNMKLKEAESNVINDKEKYKEDRKDERTKIQASQQSELIDQRKSGKPPKNFESAGFDNLGGFGLEQFDPR